MKLIIALFFLCAATTVSANPFPDGDARVGQKLFEQYDCNQCHNKIMRGDGNQIFTRVNRKRTTPQGLIEQIGMCEANVNAHFTAQEIQSIAAYLNRFYKFK